MDPQTITEKTQAIEAIRLAIAADVSLVDSLTIVMSCLLACAAAWMIVATWRREQHDKAARRVATAWPRKRTPRAGPGARPARPAKPRSSLRN
jgi:hypothetical protein